ncbi:MAG TPA: hypothetical protein VM121_09835 [Acidimicrobiales bacterium]|nr:hypothetical protein [Acidimicrobiales bacterium]
MTPRLVRRFVFAVCAVGIAGMIVGSARGDNGIALTFGLFTAAAIACLMVATAVGTGATARTETDTAGRVDDLARRIVGAGAPEADVKELVREAVRLGRERRTNRPSAAEDGSNRKEAGAGVHGGRTPGPSGETFT